jgi:membrane protein implicated in regulation of membrane protease activity
MVMGTIGSGMSGLEIFFVICALIGGGLFIIRFVIQFFGGGSVDADADIQVGHGDVDHMDADISFKLLSIQGLTAFFMMFGLVGFAMLRESRTGSGVALVSALAAGLGSVWLIGKIFSSVKKLQSSGTIENTGAIGEQGTVYLTIRAKGSGKVQVVMKGRIREFEAVEKNGEEIKTGERIRVKEVNGSVVVVERI